jgi:hypothetical protein
MKKNLTFSILVFIIFTAFNKPKILVADYRDPYSGNYFCRSSCYNKSGDTKQIVNTNDTSTIEISKDIADSVLQIRIGTNILKVKLHGKNLKAFQSGSHYGGVFFADDSLNFIYDAGRTASCKYKGKKR